MISDIDSASAVHCARL